MIRVYILNTDRLSDESIFELIDTLPFGEAEKTRLLAINSSKHKRESLGGLLALSRLLDKCCADTSGFSTEIIRSPSGKPYFNSPNAPYFGISHSQGVAAAAIVDCKYGEIGFDVELVNEQYDFMRIAERYFDGNERAELERNGNSALSFFSLWTAKEARAKIDGRGLSALLSDRSKSISDGTFLTRLCVEVGDRQAVLSVCSYVAGQSVQIYKDKDI